MVKLILAQEANIIEASLCRERLDLSTLAAVGLIPDKVSHEKKEVRSRTALL